MSSRIITVVGATGHQGKGVVAALLDSTGFKVRAVTTNPEGDKAKALASAHSDAIKSGRLELVKADLADPASTAAALSGAYGVFLAQAPGPQEVTQGKALVDAAKTAQVTHLVYSSLPSIALLSSGRFVRVFPFEAKHEIESYAREQLRNVTALIPGGFYSNLSMPWYTKRGDDGVARFLESSSPGTIRKIQFLDDEVDVGRFAAAAFAKGTAATAGKTYPIAGPGMETKELAQIYERVTGETTRVEHVSLDEILASLPPFLQPCMKEMYIYIEEIDKKKLAYGSMDPGDDHGEEDLGVKASTFEDFLRRTGFRMS